MKNLLAFLAILFAVTSFALASDPNVWSDNNYGTYTANILCTPILSAPSGTNLSLGNFWPNQTYPLSGATPMTWTLKGDPAAFYTVTIVVTQPSNATLTGALSGTPLPTHALLSGIGCETPVSFTFTPTSITTGTYTATQQSFMVTATVIASNI